jgi:hypothetical protein
MALEDRIRSSVDQALKGLLDELVSTSHDEVARQTAEAEQRLRETEQRLLSDYEQKTTQLREEEMRAQAEIQSAMQANLDRQLQEGQQQAEARLAAAIADADARAMTAARESVAAARVRERELDLAGFARVLESVRGLDGATSLSEVLDALAIGASREAARAAVVVIKGDHVVGWRLSGFGARDAQPKSIDLPVVESGVIGAAASVGRAITTRDPQAGATGPGFADLPDDHVGMAIPVLVGGRVVAVVYADSLTPPGQDRTVPSTWPEVIEVLARHAGRCLEALTAQKAAQSGPRGPKGAKGGEGAKVDGATTGAPADTSTTLRAVEAIDAARRLARLLVSEIRMYHEAAVAEGRQARNLLVRLGPEIARARAAYDARASVDASLRTDLFQQELVRTLAGGDPSLLGVSG